MMQSQSRVLVVEDDATHGFSSGFVGASPAARRVRSLTACYGRRDHPVLVTGETGTGKELVARGLHEHSPRAARPFVAVNCAAVSPALFESELFGSVRGAFTGASGSRRGLVGAARGGTLFLDEIGELPLEMQAKLLRLLEAGRYRRVGAETEEAAEVRIVAATNRPLEDAVGEGSFRRDLYYRLHVLRIHVPPLRERRADVPALVRRFLAELGEAQAAREIAPGALAALMAHDWPGNVRELRHVVERTIVAQGDACGRILGFEIAPAGTAPLPEAPRALAPAQLVALLTQHRGRLGRVAAEAGVSVRTVQRRMKDLDLRLMDFRRAGESIARGAA